MLGLMQLREDQHYPRIAAERRVALVQAALDDGRSLAERVFQRWGSDPLAIATACDVPVIRSERDANFGSLIVHAEYASRPPAITVYIPAMLRLDGLVAQAGICLPGGSVTTLPILVAHELYHHFDCLRGKLRLSRRHAVTIFRFGGLRWTSGLSSLAEIAAGAFAQQLLGLPFHPKQLDRLIMNDVRTARK